MAANMSGKYIVVFKSGVPQEQIDDYAAKVNSNGGQVTADLGLLPGFAAHIPDEYLLSLQSLTGDSEGDIISYIEPDQIVTTQAQ